MKSRVILFAAFVLMVLAIGALLAVFTTTSPTNSLIIGEFLIAFFLSFLGVIFFLTYSVKSLRQHHGPATLRRSSFNLSFTISLLATTLLTLKGVKLSSPPLTIGLSVAAVIVWFVLERRRTGEIMPRTK